MASQRSSIKASDYFERDPKPCEAVSWIPARRFAPAGKVALARFTSGREKRRSAISAKERSRIRIAAVSSESRIVHAWCRMGRPGRRRRSYQKPEREGRGHQDHDQGHRDLKLAAGGSRIIGPNEAQIRRTIEMVGDRHGSLS